MKYNVDYFIAKFRAIPEEDIIKGCLDNGLGGRCANGWCGVTNEVEENRRSVYLFGGVNEESIALKTVFSILGYKLNNDSTLYYSDIAACINNGEDDRYDQPTPKQRILAALYDIKKMQQPEARENITKQLAIESVSETLDVAAVLEPHPHRA